MHFLKNFLAGLFSLIFCFLLTFTILVFNISGFARKDNITDRVQNMDILNEVKKVRNSGSASGNTGITQIIDEMYFLASQFSVSEDVVDSIISSSITKEIIGDATGNLTDFIINGVDTPVLSEDDIYDLINNNLDDILYENNISLDDGQKEKFLREIKKQLPNIASVIPSSKDIVDGEYADSISSFQFIFSKNTKIVLCVSLFVVGLIIIILKRKGFEWCINIGVSLLISGFIVIGLSFVIPSFISSFINITDLSLFASSFLDFLSEPILYSGIGMVAMATVLFIFYKFFIKIKN